MNKQDEIMRKQNDEGMLKCQYAARTYFNRAEILLYASWIFSLISSMLLFVPDGFNKIQYIISGIIDLLTLILRHAITRNVKNGATMRNYFDAIVLGICNTYSSSEEHYIWEKANTIANANKKSFTYQITHNGKDTPSGVKDWYVFPKTYSSPEEAVFECQKQNFWWTHKLYKMRILIYIVVISVFTVIAWAGIHYSLLKTTLCLFSFAICLCSDISEFVHCCLVMQSIKTLADLDSEAINTYILEALQKFIRTRREIKLLEINMIHSKNAPKWSNLYESIFTENSHKI